MSSRIYLSLAHMGGREQEFVKEAFDTNWVVPLGPNVDGFENDICRYLGENTHTAALNSGTAAIHLALIMLGVKPGDEVVCQSFTFAASANPIVYLGATPVFTDSEPVTWNMSPQCLEDAIKGRLAKGKKVKAIIPVHLYGMPAMMDDITAIAAKYGIPVIEDAAEALGSTYKGRKCGTLGHISALSFNGNKIITTSGGGALVSANADYIREARFLATQARDEAPHYQHSHIGYNYRMSNICAGIGRGQMLALDDHMKRRKDIHNKYRKALGNMEGITVMESSSSDLDPNYWLTCIIVDPQKAKYTREYLRLALDAANIESRPLWKPMHLQPVFAHAPYYGSTVCEKLFDNGLCLPSGSALTDSQTDRVTETIITAAQRCK